jgi:hypothetical protein
VFLPRSPASSSSPRFVGQPLMDFEYLTPLPRHADPAPRVHPLCELRSFVIFVLKSCFFLISRHGQSG